jgi:hypothetical protein
MKLEFETWIQSQNLPGEAIDILEEGIKCYKVGAYRASFLMSYYFFLKVLKHRIELARHSKPDSVSQQHWQNLLDSMQDDSVWDDRLIESIRWKEDGNDRSRIYLINRDLREDMEYWRRKRNDCAHSRDNIISYPHVESFWLFIQSNLHKFIVNGGKEGLLNQVKRHFDPAITKPGEDFAFLIQHIPAVVTPQEIPALLQDIHTALEPQSTFYIEDMKSVYYAFWRDIAFTDLLDINRAFIEFITSETNVFLDFISVYPEKLMACVEKIELIRKLWKQDLFGRRIKHSDGYWSLAVTLLDNDLIDEDERTKFVRKLVYNQNASVTPTIEQIASLRTHGFFSLGRNYLIDELNHSRKSYDNANTHLDFVIFHLTHEPLDDDMVRTLNPLLLRLTYGDFIRYLPKFLNDNPVIKTRYVEYATRLQLSIPSCLIDSTEDPSE